MRSSTRVVLRAFCSAESATPVCTQKPWEWVSEFLNRLASHGHIQAVRELERKRLSRRVVGTQVDLPLSDEASVASIARRAVKSGAIFFSIKLPLAAIQAGLVEIGYVPISPQRLEGEGHVFSDEKGFDDEIEAMLPPGVDTACCFSHDGESVYLFAD